MKNSSKVRKLAILNSPLTVSSPVPGLFNQLRSVIYVSLFFLNFLVHAPLDFCSILLMYVNWCNLQYRLPLFGEFTCQNAILAERFIEAGSPYVSFHRNSVPYIPYDAILYWYFWSISQWIAHYQFAYWRIISIMKLELLSSFCLTAMCWSPRRLMYTDYHIYQVVRLDLVCPYSKSPVSIMSLYQIYWFVCIEFVLSLAIKRTSQTRESIHPKGNGVLHGQSHII